MASDQILDNYLTWGEDVQVMKSAPRKYNPGCMGSVCGIHLVISDCVAKEFGVIIGSKLYSIEFEDGITILIPGLFLTKVVS